MKVIRLDVFREILATIALDIFSCFIFIIYQPLILCYVLCVGFIAEYDFIVALFKREKDR